MKRLLLVALASFSAFADATVDPALLDRLSRGERVPVIVAMKQTRERITARQRAVIAEVGGDFTPGARWQNIPAFAGEMSIDALTELASHPDVIAISEDTGGTIAMKESSPLIGLPPAHTRGYNGAGVTVAVIDTGIDNDHPDFRGRITGEQCWCRTASGKGCCPNGSTAQSGSGAARDDHGHGTNVTGILASGGARAEPGVASYANIVALRVTDAAGSWSYTSQVISALDYLISSRPDVRVVNISLGTDKTFATACDNVSAEAMAIASAVRTLRARGTAVFAASGNHGAVVGITFPGCIDPITSVGAVYDAKGTYSTSLCTATNTTVDGITCFSNGSPLLDLLAPGAWITSSGRGGVTSTYGGTSQASPQAAGAAAVLFASKPSLTVEQMEALLRSTGTVINDPRNGVGVPRINVGQAVDELRRGLKKRRATGR